MSQLWWRRSDSLHSTQMDQWFIQYENLASFRSWLMVIPKKIEIKPNEAKNGNFLLQYVVLTREPIGSIPSIPRRTTEVVNNLEIKRRNGSKNVEETLCWNKSCGPDAVHLRKKVRFNFLDLRMLKELAVPITFLVNKTLDKNEISLD